MAPSQPTPTRRSPGTGAPRQGRRPGPSASGSSVALAGALAAALTLGALGPNPAAAQGAGASAYRPADQGQRPDALGGVQVLPEQFLRGFDPITAYFPGDQVQSTASADDGAKRLKIVPEWPGAWSWIDRRTLQFRPAEPWPALARFQAEAAGAKRTLTTMMTAPSAMTPAPGTEGLKPFRVLTLTFPQMFPVASLKKMLTFEVRDLPGLADSATRRLADFTLSALPRASHQAPVTWAVTFDEEIPEGKVLVVSASLALGTEGTTLWQGRVATRSPFVLEAVTCGGAGASLGGGTSLSKDVALACGARGDLPQLHFSAPVAALSLTKLRALVRLEPAVPDLHVTSSASKTVQLAGTFVPSTLYKLTLSPTPLRDDAGRELRAFARSELYFHRDWVEPFLTWAQATALLEAKGPRSVPVRGYGDARADVRIYRVDPLHLGLWPFPSAPVTVDEQRPPPFPGDEPSVPALPSERDRSTLEQHLRLLGSPLVSKIVDLPLPRRGAPTTFGIDLRPLLDPVVGRERPGTYLVGLRRLTGAKERSYMRVQVTNLSVTSLEETGRALLFVRALDTGAPVRGARVRLEGLRAERTPRGGERTVPAEESLTTDGEGRVTLEPRPTWRSIDRVVVSAGDDVLVIDPQAPLPGFAQNHWSSSGGWLAWLRSLPRTTAINDARLAFVFTERPIYKPGEPVFIKGYLREKVNGALQVPGQLDRFRLLVTSPDGQSWPLETKVSAETGAFSAEFRDDSAPTGELTAALVEARDTSTVLARRSFRVEAYRVPTFEVQVLGPQRVRNDAPFKVKAVARYFAGGSVAEQPVEWSVTQRPYAWTPRGMEGFIFASSSQFGRSGSERPPLDLKRTGTLDDDGAAELALNPQLDLDGSARAYDFEATVTGADEQRVAATARVLALPPFTLGLKVARYLPSADALSPEVVVMGVDDKPVKGQAFELKLLRRMWHSSLRETSFATGKAKYETSQSDEPVASVNLTSGDKPVAHRFPIKDSGVYVVRLQARDRLGRVQSLEADLYVGGPTPQAWRKSRDGVFELKPDKPSYAPGETAHLLVQSPYTAAKALVVIEEPQGNRYLWRDVSGSQAVVDVPITERMAPNVPLHVVLMRGRLGEGKADDSRYRPATAAASIDLSVKPVRNTLTVAVAHPTLARPGTTHDFTVTLSDEAKRPVGGEVTLWLVDAAVLSLAPEGTLDPLSAFIQRNRASVSIRDTRNLVLGQVAELDEEPGGDGEESEGDEAASGKRLVRKEFKSVPYYAATLVVPPSGKLVVPVKLSDDLTTFKVRAVAVSGATRFGLKQSELKVRLPVLVQPQLPRFVRMGDRFWPGATARVVEGPSGPAAVDVVVGGAVESPVKQRLPVEVLGAKAQSVLVPVTVKATAPDSEPTVKVRVDVTRLSDKAGDAFEVQLPVLADRRVETVASFATLQPGTTTLAPFAEPPRPGTASQSAIFTNQPGVLELASALEYLRGYPHGCLEQRMSQVQPDLELAALLKRLELEPRQPARSASSVRRLLEELAAHQGDGGLVGYWPGSRGDIALTAQAVEFMTAAKKVGHAIDEKVLARAQEALRRVLRSDATGLWAEYRYNQQTAALRALGRSGRIDENYLVQLFHARKQLDASSVADLTAAMALRANAFAANLGALKTELWESLVFQLAGGKTVFAGVRGDRRTWDGAYLGSPSATAASVWEVLLRLDPGSPKHGPIRDAVLSQAHPLRAWGNTHANRRALAALGAYLDSSASAQPAATVASPRFANVVLDAQRKAGRRAADGAEPIAVTVSGAPVTVRLQQQSVPLAGGGSVRPKQEGFVVSRSLTWLHGDDEPPTHHEDTADRTLTLKVGDVVEIHARLVTTERRANVALVVPIAAGLEPLNPALANAGVDATPSESDSVSATFVQRLDHEQRYYFEDLPAGTYGFHFRARATSEGDFVHPPPWAELMYRQEVHGRGAGTRIAVAGSRQK